MTAQFSPAVASDAIVDEIRRLGPWFHNIHLPGGIETSPHHAFGDFPSFKWRQIEAHLPADLTGWTALDIGCNAGFYTFELAKRGARVTGVEPNPHYLAQARWAARRLNLDHLVTFEQDNIYSFGRRNWQGGYDIVLFMGVFYHLRYPQLAFDTIARMKPRLMLFQTLEITEREVHAASQLDHNFSDREIFAEPGWPRMAFIEGQFSGDPTNWWIPNRACVLALLRDAGFDVMAEPGHEMYLCRWAREPSYPQLRDAEWRNALGAT